MLAPAAPAGLLGDARNEVQRVRRAGGRGQPHPDRRGRGAHRRASAPSAPPRRASRPASAWPRRRWADSSRRWARAPTPTHRCRRAGSGLPDLRRHPAGFPGDRPGRLRRVLSRRSMRRSGSCCDGCTAPRITRGCAISGSEVAPAAGAPDRRRPGAARPAPPRDRGGTVRAGRRAAGPAQGARMIDSRLLPDGGMAWLEASGPGSHLVVSTRVRLARNLRPASVRHPDATAGRAGGDPGRGGSRGGRHHDRARPGRAVPGGPAGPGRPAAPPRAPPGQPGAGRAGDRRTGPAGGPDCWSRTSASVMINEEDHLRLQALRSGFALEATWGHVATLDTELGQRLAFAFHPEFGYLTELSDQRRNRAPRLGAGAPSGAGFDEGNQQDPAGSDPGRTDLSGTLRGGQRGRRQSVPVVEPDHAGQDGTRVAGPPGQAGPAGHGVRGAGAPDSAAGRHRDSRGQGAGGRSGSSATRGPCRSRRP